MEDTLRDTLEYFNKILKDGVLILVLMEDTLRALSSALIFLLVVLILVLMEDTLRV